MRDEDFVAFVQARGAQLLRFAYLTCGRAQDAADLTQDALAAAYVHWGRIERIESPEAYVRRAIVNRHISLWRKHRDRTVSLVGAERLPAPDSLSSVEDRGTTTSLLQILPRKQRAAIVMRYYADYTDAEIAEVLHCSESTVRSQISRGLERMRQAAHEEFSEVST